MSEIHRDCRFQRQRLDATAAWEAIVRVRSIRVVWVVVWLSGVCASVRSQAEETDASELEYKAAIDQAVAEHQAHAFEEALALFASAYRRWPNARVLRGMGQVEYDLRRYVECVAHLQQALASQVKPLSAPLRRETQELLHKAQQYVSRVVLKITPSVAGERITVDGAGATLQADGSLLLQIGRHVIDVQADGFQPERRELLLSSGGNDAQLLSIVLQPNSARVTVAIKPATAAVKLSVDGSAVALPLDGALQLHVGERTLEARADGFEPERRTLVVQDAQEQRVEFALRPIHGVASASDSPTLWQNPWLWTGIGAAVVGGVTAAILVSAGGHTHTADPYQGNLGSLRGPDNP